MANDELQEEPDASRRERLLKGERRTLEVRAVSAFLGALALLGWLQLSWLSAAFAPMGYTTALVFVVTGISIVGHCAGYRSIAVWGGAFAAGIGSMALAEDMLGRSPMIVSSLLPNSLSEAAFHARPRMSWMTALCFALSGVMLVTFRMRGVRKRWRRTALITLASTIVGVGVVGLLGYAIHDQSEYGWARFTRMELSTALGFVVLGTAFFGMVGGLRRPDRLASVPRWAPWAFGGVVAALAIALWVNLTAADAKVRRTAITRANAAAVHNANAQIEDHLRALERTGQVVGFVASEAPRLLRTRTPELLADDMKRPGVVAALYVDGERSEQLRLGDEQLLDEVLAVSGGTLPSSHGESTVVSSTFRTQSSLGALWITVPVGETGASLAYLHDVDALLEAVFRTDAMRTIHVDVTDPAGRVFALDRDERAAALVSDERAVAASGFIAIGDKTWSVRTTADESWLSGSRGVSNTLLLWFGGFLAAAITLVIRMTQRERERAASLHNANEIIAKQFQEQRHAAERLAIQTAELRIASMRLDEQATEQRRVLDSLSAFVIGVDGEGRVVEWNQVAQELFGVETTEAIGATFEDLAEHWLEGRASASIRECLETRERARCANVIVPEREGRNAECTISFTVNPTDHRSRRGYSLIGADVTERQRLETQLHHAQRLEAVGTLAAGIAHEINTPMQYVGDNLRFVSEQVGPITDLLRALPEAIAEVREAGCEAPKVVDVEKTVSEMDVDFVAEELPMALGETLEGVERVVRIVRAMKDFSHPGDEGRKAADINRAIETTLDVARNEYKYVADVETEFGDIPLVPSWIADLNQVFLNLVVNAAHAIEDAIEGTTDRGTIRIATAPVEVDNDAGEPESFVEIRISDSGCGIPEDAREKIFDQFFTTKEVGKGTGQGLAIAWAVVCDKHGGQLSFESEVGEGTTFIIRLPTQVNERDQHEQAHPDPVC